jgi:hypothetical protein
MLVNKKINYKLKKYNFNNINYNNFFLNKKTQTYSIDAIIALIIFIIIFLTISKVWDNSTIKFSNHELRNDFEMVFRNSFETLFSTQGNPTNWHLLENTWYIENENNKSIDLGIISNDNKLDLSKLDKFKDENFYNDSKKLIGLNGPKYEYLIKINFFKKLNEHNLNNYKSLIFGYKKSCSNSLILNKIRIINETDFALIEFKGCIAN